MENSIAVILKAHGIYEDFCQETTRAMQTQEQLIHLKKEKQRQQILIKSKLNEENQLLLTKSNPSLLINASNNTNHDRNQTSPKNNVGHAKDDDDDDDDETGSSLPIWSARISCKGLGDSLLTLELILLFFFTLRNA